MHLMHICARENIFLAQHGEVDCWPLDCPPTPSCLAPVLVPGACCPSCPACNNNSSCGPHAGWWPPSPAISHSHMNIFLQDCCDKKATLGDFPRPPAPPAYARFFISFHFKSSPVMQISLHPKSMKIQTHKSVILIC